MQTVEATIVGQQPLSRAESAIWSEAALALDWDNPEEDAAWLHLGQAR